MSVVRHRRTVALACAGVLGLTATAASAAPLTAPWHLDRINQRALPLDGNNDRGLLTGAGIDIYIVDTGLRLDHVELAGRTVAGIDVPTANQTSTVDPPASDCDGHGTHVAGLAAATTVGVATAARIIAVRVLDCNGDGEVEDVVEALKWVRAHHRGGRLAVVNLSLGVDLGDDGTAINEQVLALIDEGIVVTVAAGNGDSTGRGFDGCEIAPGNVARALTVGATTANDAAATYSNYGSCVDVWAPGGDRTKAIESLWNESADDFGFDIGTSMSSPLVAGYVAQLAEQQPGICPDAANDAVITRATPGVVTGLDATSPNRLLFLDPAPVVPTTPGRVSHVMVTADTGSLVVSWDPSCDGGSPITGTTVSVLRNGKVVKRVVADPGETAVRVKGLASGVRYHVVVKPENAVGPGVATSRLRAPAVRGYRAGQSIPLAQVGITDGDLSLTWSSSSGTAKVCRVDQATSRLVLRRAGTCRVGLRTLEGQDAVVRTIRVVP